jgi:hypothetical protein
MARLVVAVLLLHPLLVADTIWVRYRDQVTEKERGALEKDVGGNLQFKTRFHWVGEIFEYGVPNGHAGFWKEVLRDSPIVETAGEVQYMASIKRETTVYSDAIEPSKPRTSLPVQGTSQELFDRIQGFFGSRYKGQGRLQPSACGSSCISMTVDHLRGVVIESEKLWERIDFYIVLSPKGPQTNLHLIMDGYYAAGLGTQPPGISSYTAMEVRYFREFSTYADRLIADLRQVLERKL